jgi:hypothetical protein
MAAAWDNPPPSRTSITVSPTSVPRGGQLTIEVDAPECRASGGSVTSPVFPDTALQPRPGSRALVANPRVNSNAGQGLYDVTVRCDGRIFSKPAAFTVIGGVMGGLGGSVTGTTGADAAIGGALVAAALGGGVVVMRRRAVANAV